VARERWIAARRRELLPTRYLHVAVSLDEGSSSSADEIGNLERRPGHWTPPQS
jgi:hypothetical protein